MLFTNVGYNAFGNKHVKYGRLWGNRLCKLLACQRKQKDTMW